MKRQVRPSASLYCIFAANADKAVIFRRGPSKQILLISWDLKKHSFKTGQWFKGRIYPEKSDLSPNGEKLVYYAAKFSKKLRSWIAVSNPPFLTALVLWEALGAWNDLSLFETNNLLALSDHRHQSASQPYKGFSLPRQLRVKYKAWPGYFYVLPEHERMLRDGWSVYSGEPIYQKKSPESEQPLIYKKLVSRVASLYLCLEVISPKKIKYIISDKDGNLFDLNAQWAESRGKDIFYSQGGKLMRIKIKDKGCLTEYVSPIELADFTSLTFEALESPPSAKKW